MKKQIILLMTDTTRKDMVGCYGNKKMFTPNLDALAQEGIRYENAYTCQPVCGPARSAIFTGTFPHSNGMVTNGVPLGANVKTIGQRLTDNGIKCGYIGKWHLDGGDYFGLGCCPEGWDAMRDIPVRMISFGGSNYNISFLIRECDKNKALQSLSDALFNEE